ncbi:hypothetical protein U1Q18_013415 [Sarracenia purpurea var. burkii]
MGATLLSEFLQSLCQNSHWNYAVFWKLKQENQLLLTWEEGCYDHLKLRGCIESIQGDTGFDGSNKVYSSGWGFSRHSGEYLIGQAVADMASVQYPWGVGVVGDVAYTGNHYWVLLENVSAGEFEPKVVPEFPYEWQLQIAAGIKTIVLISVIPHGVLQLGTLEKVAEDQTMVAHIKDKFNAYQNHMDLQPFTSMEFRAQTSSSPMPTLMDNLDESSTTTANQMNSEDLKTVGGFKSTNNTLQTNDQIMQMCLVQDAHHIAGKDGLEILNGTRENEFSSQSMGLVKVSKSLAQSLNDTELEMLEELQAFLYSDNYNVGILGEQGNIATNSFSDGYMIDQPFEDADVKNRGHKNVNHFFSFPLDCDLHRAFEPALLGQTEEYLWDPSLASEDVCYSSSQILNRDLIHGVESRTRESGEWSARRDDAEAEQLLEAEVASMQSDLIDNLSNQPNDLKLPIVSLRQLAASTKEQNHYEESELVEEKRVPRSSMATAARGRYAVIESPTASSLESMMNTLSEERQKKKGHGYLQTRKGSKLSNSGKRRARPGEKQRPRPRDRQLIQDRVKELRELVPNGSKCSIDGLLDKTIKHMLFLRSVSDQAKKLRQWVHQEVSECCRYYLGILFHGLCQPFSIMSTIFFCLVA